MNTSCKEFVFGRVAGGGVLSFHHKKRVSFRVVKTCKLV